MTTNEFTQRLPEGPRGGPGSVGHHPSHLEVVGRVPRYPVDADQSELSAVVVPTSRPLRESRVGLALAAHCAEVRNAPLVVIRSGAAIRDPFPPELAARTSRPTIVIDLPNSSHPFLPGLSNARHPVATKHRKNDVGDKRNLAVLIGLLAGWETMLLLDDDITTRRASQLPLRSQHLSPELVMRLDDVFAEFKHNPHLMAAGYLQKDFDDNSVVCHVRKLAGLEQEGFISGGAVVIRCIPGLPYFPAAYNEDWLFLFFLMMQDWHRCPSSGVKRIGSIHQSAYYPFAAPRAKREEFGDAFAEGLFNLLELSPEEIAREARSLEYWKHVVHARQSMITHMLAGFQDRYGPTEHAIVNDVESALRAALSVYPDSLAKSATLMAGYFDALMADLPTWNEHTRSLAATYGRGAPLNQALSVLKVESTVSEVYNPGVQWLPQQRRKVAP
jgi:hypothetical protein